MVIKSSSLMESQGAGMLCGVGEGTMVMLGVTPGVLDEVGFAVGVVVLVGVLVWDGDGASVDVMAGVWLGWIMISSPG